MVGGRGRSWQPFFGVEVVCGGCRGISGNPQLSRVTLAASVHLVYRSLIPLTATYIMR